VPTYPRAAGVRAGNAHCLPEQEQEAGAGAAGSGTSGAREPGQRAARSARE